MRLAPVILAVLVALPCCTLIKRAAPPRPAPFRGGLAFVDAQRHIAAQDEVVVREPSERNVLMHWRSLSPDRVRVEAQWAVRCEHWTTSEVDTQLRPGWMTRVATRIVARRANEAMQLNDPFMWMQDPSRGPLSWGNERLSTAAQPGRCALGPAAFVALEVFAGDGTRQTVPLDEDGSAELTLSGPVIVVAQTECATRMYVDPSIARGGG